MGSLYIFTIAHHSLPGVVIKTDGAPIFRRGARAYCGRRKEPERMRSMASVQGTPLQ